MTDISTEASRAQKIAQFLTDEGFHPVIEDGDVSFKYEGRRFFIVIDEKDAEYYRVMRFNFWPIESEEERLVVNAAAGAVSRGTKCVKVFPVDDDVSASVDILAHDVDALLKELLRAIELCSARVERFPEAVARATEEAKDDDDTVEESEGTTPSH